MAGGPYTAASMNPARSLAPALWNWNWENHWVYWIAPLSAGLFSSLFYRVIFWRKNPEDELTEEIALSDIQYSTISAE
jgi:aquaporin rerated protein, invertebrate